MSIYLLRYVGADRLPRKLPPQDLGTYFQLSRKDIEALQSRLKADRYPHASDRAVGLAAQLVFMRATGRALAQISNIPTAMLSAIGRALKVPAPRIATLRAIYKREKTLYHQQVWAREHLGFRASDATDHTRFRAMLAAHADEVNSTDELVRDAQHWFYNEKLLVPAEGSLRELAAKAFAHVEREAVRAMKRALSEKQLDFLLQSVLGDREDEKGRTVLGWLKQPPMRHSKKTRNATTEKIAYLKEIGAHKWDLKRISLKRQHAYSQALSSKPPSETKRRLKDVQQLQIVCFLRMTLLELTESFVTQSSRRTADLVRHAYEKTTQSPVQTAKAYRDRMLAMQAVLDDESLDQQARLDALTEAIRSALDDLAPVPRAALMRRALVEDGKRVHELLESMADMDFKSHGNDLALLQLEAWKQLQKDGVSELPTDHKVPAGKVWKDLVDGDDRKAALTAVEASTLLGLRRGLRRGSVWLDHSLSYRERDEMLIPPEEWAKERDRHVALLGLGKSADGFISAQLKVLRRGIKALKKAIRLEEISVDEHGVVHLPQIKAEELAYDPKKVRSLVYASVGDVQLPDLLLEMDAATNFSEILLGRRAYDEQELLAVYAALLAHGTEMDAKSVAAMIPQLEPSQVSTVMRLLETPGRLEKANQRVVEFMNRHPITRKWGDGTLASSDMMSLEATRHLVTARMDPRRRTPSVGIYSHVTNTYALAYSQQWVLNDRQAGPAVHGVVRFNAMNDQAVLKLAVDTHGYTYPATTIAKLLGFDLCVRLQNLKERKLYVPTDTDVPSRHSRSRSSSAWAKASSAARCSAASTSRLRSACKVWHSNSTLFRSSTRCSIAR